MASRRVTALKPRHARCILVLGALLLCLLRLQHAFLEDFEHVPSLSVSFSLAVPFLKTRSAFVRVRTCPRTIFSYSRRPSSATIFFLLLISGDVEVNPGPTDNQPAPATGNAQPVSAAAGNSQPVPAAQLPATASSGMLLIHDTVLAIFIYLFLWYSRYGVA